MKLKIFAAIALIAFTAAACNKASQTPSTNTAPTSQNSSQTTTDSQQQQQATQNTSSQAPAGTHFSSGEEMDVAPQPEVREVDITASGFVPQVIDVNAGDYVKFINKDSGPHWPASNPHPTHTDLPGFDALKALQQGQSYTFQFVKVGSWGYHDHLNPSTGGTVVVK